jgi:hypothetical protein
MENKKNKINMKYYSFYRWVCMCLCVCCVYIHAPNSFSCIKFHKLKVLLEITALSARNRVIQLQMFLVVPINSLPSGCIKMWLLFHGLLTGHIFQLFCTGCPTRVFVSWFDSFIASRLSTAWCRMLGPQVTYKHTGHDSIFGTSTQRPLIQILSLFSFCCSHGTA